MTISVRGADDLADLGRALRESGDRELRRELFRALNRATKEPKAAAKKELSSVLPSGSRIHFAGLRLNTRTRVSGRWPGVRVQSGKSNHDWAALNRGRLRHPLFGRRGPGQWFNTSIEPGWFSRPMGAAVDQMRGEILTAIDDVRRRVAAS